MSTRSLLSILRDIANDVDEYGLQCMAGIVARLRTLADEQESSVSDMEARVKIASGGLLDVTARLERAAQAVQEACDRLEAVTVAPPDLDVTSEQGFAPATAEAFQRLVVEQVFAPIVEQAQARSGKRAEPTADGDPRDVSPEDHALLLEVARSVADHRATAEVEVMNATLGPRVRVPLAHRSAWLTMEQARALCGALSLSVVVVPLGQNGPAVGYG